MPKEPDGRKIGPNALKSVVPLLSSACTRKPISLSSTCLNFRSLLYHVSISELRWKELAPCFPVALWVCTTGSSIPPERQPVYRECLT